MVLDDLYCGNIYPAEQVVPHEKEYRKLHRHTGELLTELEEKLSKEQMELVNQFGPVKIYAQIGLQAPAE